jgi:hypothetical protein
MPIYRAYKLDEKGHVFDPLVIIVASSDTDALTYAKRLVDSHDLEIWGEARRVGVVSSARLDGCFLQRPLESWKAPH